jgi:hypothetical protein
MKRRQSRLGSRGKFLASDLLKNGVSLLPEFTAVNSAYVNRRRIEPRPVTTIAVTFPAISNLAAASRTQQSRSSVHGLFSEN